MLLKQPLCRRDFIQSTIAAGLTLALNQGTASASGLKEKLCEPIIQHIDYFELNRRQIGKDECSYLIMWNHDETHPLKKQLVAFDWAHKPSMIPQRNCSLPGNPYEITLSSLENDERGDSRKVLVTVRAPDMKRTRTNHDPVLEYQNLGGKAFLGLHPSPAKENEILNHELIKQLQLAQ